MAFWKKARPKKAPQRFEPQLHGDSLRSESGHQHAIHSPSQQIEPDDPEQKRIWNHFRIQALLSMLLDLDDPVVTTQMVDFLTRDEVISVLVSFISQPTIIGLALDIGCEKFGVSGSFSPRLPESKSAVNLQHSGKLHATTRRANSTALKPATATESSGFACAGGGGGGGVPPATFRSHSAMCILGCTPRLQQQPLIGAAVVGGAFGSSSSSSGPPLSRPASLLLAAAAAAASPAGPSSPLGGGGGGGSGGFGGVRSDSNPSLCSRALLETSAGRVAKHMAEAFRPGTDSNLYHACHVLNRLCVLTPESLFGWLADDGGGRSYSHLVLSMVHQLTHPAVLPAFLALTAPATDPALPPYAPHAPPSPHRARPVSAASSPSSSFAATQAQGQTGGQGRTRVFHRRSSSPSAFALPRAAPPPRLSASPAISLSSGQAGSGYSATAATAAAATASPSPSPSPLCEAHADSRAGGGASEEKGEGKGHGDSPPSPALSTTTAAAAPAAVAAVAATASRRCQPVLGGGVGPGSLFEHLSARARHIPTPRHAAAPSLAAPAAAAASTSTSAGAVAMASGGMARSRQVYAPSLPARSRSIGSLAAMIRGGRAAGGGTGGGERNGDSSSSSFKPSSPSGGGGSGSGSGSGRSSDEATTAASASAAGAMNGDGGGGGGAFAADSMFGDVSPPSHVARCSAQTKRVLLAHLTAAGLLSRLLTAVAEPTASLSQASAACEAFRLLLDRWATDTEATEALNSLLCDAAPFHTLAATIAQEVNLLPCFRLIHHLLRTANMAQLPSPFPVTPYAGFAATVPSLLPNTTHAPHWRASLLRLLMPSLRAIPVLLQRQWQRHLRWSATAAPSPRAPTDTATAATANDTATSTPPAPATPVGFGIGHGASSDDDNSACEQRRQRQQQQRSAVALCDGVTRPASVSHPAYDVTVPFSELRLVMVDCLHTLTSLYPRCVPPLLPPRCLAALLHWVTACPHANMFHCRLAPLLRLTLARRAAHSPTLDVLMGALTRTHAPLPPPPPEQGVGGVVATASAAPSSDAVASSAAEKAAAAAAVAAAAAAAAAAVDAATAVADGGFLSTAILHYCRANGVSLSLPPPPHAPPGTAALRLSPMPHPSSGGQQRPQRTQHRRRGGQGRVVSSAGGAILRSLLAVRLRAQSLPHASEFRTRLRSHRVWRAFLPHLIRLGLQQAAPRSAPRHMRFYTPPPLSLPFTLHLSRATTTDGGADGERGWRSRDSCSSDDLQPPSLPTPASSAATADGAPAAGASAASPASAEEAEAEATETAAPEAGAGAEAEAGPTLLAPPCPHLPPSGGGGGGGGVWAHPLVLAAVPLHSDCYCAVTPQQQQQQQQQHAGGVASSGVAAAPAATSSIDLGSEFAESLGFVCS